MHELGPQQAQLSSQVKGYFFFLAFSWLVESTQPFESL